MAQLMETERKRAVKPPFRYLPEGERNEMLNVRARLIYLNTYFLFFTLFSVSISHLLIICACVCTTKPTAFADIYTRVFHSGTEDKLGWTSQGIFTVANAHRHGTKNEKENHVGEATEQLGERHRPVREEPLHLCVPRCIDLWRLWESSACLTINITIKYYFSFLWKIMKINRYNIS